MAPVSRLSSVAAALAAAACLASCANEPRLDLLGDPAPPQAATETMVIGPTTGSVHVTGGDTVLFVVGQRSFAWHFDTSIIVWAFPLNRVAPPGLLDHKVMAYVAPDPRYIGADVNSK